VEGTNPTLIANATYENTPANLNVTTSFETYTVSAAVDTASTTNIILFIWSDVTDTTAGDFLYVTNVQLEKGTQATSFDYRAYGTELALCQRYYQLLQNAGGGRAESATYVNIPFRTIGSMRSAPTGSLVGTIQTRDLTAAVTKTANTPSSLTFTIANDSGGYLEFGASSWSAANYTIGNLIALACATGINGIALSSEL
jgi:hypothetical protein